MTIRFLALCCSASFLVDAFSSSASVKLFEGSSAFGVTTSSSKFSSDVSTISSRPNSNLRLGFMEEFLSDTDSSNREVENKQYLATLTSRVERINALETDIEDLSDDELVSKTDEFRLRLKNGEDINGKILEEAFAVVREAAWYVM